MTYSNLWIEKYSPKSSSEIIGNELNIKWIKKWLNYFNKVEEFPNFKNGLLISGSPGIGKTTMVHLLLKEMGFDIIEFNASDVRSGKIIRDRLKSLINSSNIMKMINSTNKIGIIMDEVDASITDKGSLKEILSYIENDQEFIISNNKKIKRNSSLKNHINRYPIICICNKLSSSIKILSQSCIHIKLKDPTEKNILEIIEKVSNNESILMNLSTKKLLIPHCQSDIRRTIHILENIKSYFKEEIITSEKIDNVIHSFAQKDLDIDLFDCIRKINNTSLEIKDSLQLFSIDKTFIPLLLHENFNRNLEKNKIDSKKNKINRMLNYYDNLITGIKLDSSVYENNNWELSDYVGVLTVSSANFELNNNIVNTDIEKYTDVDSTPVFSKINYKFYNLKLINSICRKIDIKATNFQDFTFTLYKLFIISKPIEKDYRDFLNNIKKKNLTFSEFDKSIKLSYLFEEYKNNYTAKKKKELEKLFMS